ncbi:MAG: hypothetical protein ACLFUF_00310 [Opitutales bacterium]
MKKYILHLFTPVCLLLIVLGLSSPFVAEGRIGESKRQIENRLFDSGGIIYRDENTRNNLVKRAPYSNYLSYFDRSVEVRVYFKTADGSNPTTRELNKGNVQGWEMHVVYAGGRSIIEVYKKDGGMTEYERNGLLNKHAGNSYWKTKKQEQEEQEQEEKGEEEETAPSVFGYDMVRNDGEIRAKKAGGGLMFFDAEVDEKLAEIKEEDLQEKAPTSVKGF